MKKYEHTKGIQLRKAKVLYYSSVDGSVISRDVIRWVVDKSTQLKHAYINNRVYTYDTFNDEFKIYMDRFNELKLETLKKSPVHIDDTMPFTYDVVSDPGFYTHEIIQSKINVSTPNKWMTTSNGVRWMNNSNGLNRISEPLADPVYAIRNGIKTKIIGKYNVGDGGPK